MTHVAATFFGSSIETATWVGSIMLAQQTDVAPHDSWAVVAVCVLTIGFRVWRELRRRNKEK